MGLWSWLTGKNWEGETPNPNPSSSVGPVFNPGDPEGFEIEESEVEPRGLTAFYPSPWSGWPSQWSTPNWDPDSRFNALIDVAWGCLDTNASVLSTMPVYRTRGEQIIEPISWMVNPDPMIYSSWHEFAKQVFWDFQLGEVFILPMSHFSDGFPMRFRVIPSWAIHVEMKGGAREYRLGGIEGPDVSEEILHIRYKSTSDGARGVGPLESAGGRMLTAGLLQKYLREFAETGGVVTRTLETEDSLTPEEAQDLVNQYLASRSQTAVGPPVFDGGVKLVDHTLVSPKDATMLELGQFTESRIAILLGVPPFLVGLPSGGDSMTYSNVSALFDFHDRKTLRPLASHVMGALSNWALPSGQGAELNRDEYSRPSFTERAAAWEKLVNAQIVSAEDVRKAERFRGVAPMTALTETQVAPVTEPGGEE